MASTVDSRKPSLVQRVRVDRDLDAGLVGDAQAGVDRGGGRAPVLVQLEPAGAAAHLLEHPFCRDGVPLAEQQDVHGLLVHRAEHRRERALAGGDGGRLAALGGTGAAADQGGDPGGERLVDDLRADQVDMAVDAAGGEDPALAGEDLGARADPERGVHAVGDIRVAGLAERDDPAVSDADVALEDAPVVEDDRVRDHQVGSAFGPRGRALEHRLADRLAAAEDGLVAADALVPLDLDPEVRVGEPDPVAVVGP